MVYFSDQSKVIVPQGHVNLQRVNMSDDNCRRGKASWETGTGHVSMWRCRFLFQKASVIRWDLNRD